MWDKLKEQFNLLKLEKKKLCLITNSDRFISKDDFLDAIASALQGGVDMVLLNEKNIPDGIIVDIGRKIRMLCDEYGATYIVKDRCDIALITEADGVHLAQNGICIADAKELLEQNAIIGKSVSNPDEVKAAVNNGADYLIMTPVYGQTIPDMEFIAGINKDLKIPVFIAGGINQSNINEILQFKVNKLALADELMYAKIPEFAARDFIKRL